MDKTVVIKKCKELGCCDACCLRFVGIKNPTAYENPQQYMLKYLQDIETKPTTVVPKEQVSNDEFKNEVEIDKTACDLVEDRMETNSSQTETEIKKEILQKMESMENTEEENPSNLTSDSEVKIKNKSPDMTDRDEGINRNGTSPPAKRRKSDICVSCIDILQESSWVESLEMVKEQLDKKNYDCDFFACALSAPIATLLREKVITLHITSVLETYNANCVTPLKEAWKWSFGEKLKCYIKKTLVSGTIAPLLITITIEYPNDIEELEILKVTSPKLFEMRRQQKKRFTIEFTRRSVEEALDELTGEALKQLGLTTPSAHVKCVSVITSHVPCYLAGRYIKLSRELPQTPWFVGGKRMMESSVQEIIFEPIAKLYGMTLEDIESRLKLMSAGREDVDVRCLGEGRPFAIEVLDPSRRLTDEELHNACEEINKTGKVILNNISYISKDDLTLLKKGEEVKTKCYEALCIKLSHSENDDQNAPITVTDSDIANINSYRNTDETGTRVVVQQKTPIRVLHRRPLLTRTRKIHELSAEKVPGHPNLFAVQVSTEAGTYVKEWAHGELGRSVPSLGTALGACIDILALDVIAVNLPWPPSHTGER